ncbi:MAG TPA: CHAT domain-containing protein [Trichocoleus sp.]|jgi:CHAT domain-containing protein/Tfp pilus assembly protein PilF
MVYRYKILVASIVVGVISSHLCIKNLAWAVESKQQIQEVQNIQQEEADQLYENGETYSNQGEFASAIDLYQEALTLYRTIGDVSGETNALYGIGHAYHGQGNYEKAIEVFQETLSLARRTNNSYRTWRTLVSIGAVYGRIGQFAQAVASNQEALSIVQRSGRPQDEQRVLTGSALTYTYLGEYEQAISLYQRALQLNHQIHTASSEDRAFQQRSESIILHNMGWAYELMQQLPLALENYQMSLEIDQELGDQSGQADSLNAIGFTQYKMGKLDDALLTLKQSLDLSQDLNDRDSLAYTLTSIGRVYAALKKTDEAWSAYQQALFILAGLNNLPEQRNVLSHLGDLLVQQNQPQLAILFYKRSVNVTESIRQDIRGLPIEQQQSYTNTIADTYRRLADLLLQQNRVLEAQQVLDLLKVQEIQDYLRRGVRGNEQTAQGVDLLAPERQISENYDALVQRAIESGRRLIELEAIPAENRTPEQQQEVLQLRQTQGQIKSAFNDFLAQPDVLSAIQQLQIPGVQAIDPSDLSAIQDKLYNLKQDVVLIYPLVLPDRLELVVMSPHSVPIHRSVAVTQIELNHAISDFLTALKDPTSDVKPSAQRLYNWLIKPIESELAQANAKTILYAPDRQLRYIPLAALHDGHQWLIERFRVNYITAVSLFNLDTRPQTQPHIIAGAFAEGRYNVQRGDYYNVFNGLPFARTEVQAIGALFPNTRELVDRAFTREATLPVMNDYNIVHLATHATFSTGAPEDSFIVFGDGNTVSLRDVGALTLRNVDMIVLSACQTAVSSLALGDGKEILGFGYQIQQSGARAAIASLWSVDDGGTEALMRQFYTQLRQPNLTKAAALQQAQIALIHGASTPEVQAHLTDLGEQPLNLIHPHYWSPFILIGNGL